MYERKFKTAIYNYTLICLNNFYAKTRISQKTKKNFLKVLTRSRTDHFEVGVTYLLFSVQVCFSAFPDRVSQNQSFV